jgi:tetratricopeptide (TPR) repeat protein
MRLVIRILGWLAAALIWQAAAVTFEETGGLLPPAGELSPLGRQVLDAIRAADWARAAQLTAQAPGGDGAFWSGYVKLRLGNPGGAIRDLRRAQKTASAPHVRKTLAAAYYAERQYVLFRGLMEAETRESPQDFAPHYYLGRHCDTDLRDFAAAELHFRAALDRAPAHAPSHYYLGFALEKLGRAAEAEASFARARELAPAFPEPWSGLARLRLTAGRAEEALPLAREAVRLAPQDAAGRKLLARALTTLGRTGEALAEWTRAAELDSTDASVRYQIYRAALALGDRALATRARREYEDLRRLYGVE